jgi:hypothetical protein
MSQNILTQYGIKEVADVQFIALAADTRLGVSINDVVLYLDSLKVSTIETTSEQTEAKGGKGAPPLIIWDYGKEITLTLQDALMTPASLGVLYGAAAVEAGDTDGVVRMVEKITVAAGDTCTFVATNPPLDGSTIKFHNLTTGVRGSMTAAMSTQVLTMGTDGAPDDLMIFFWDVVTEGTEGTDSYTITIDAAHFPGTYKVIGDTLIRNTLGTDEKFQLVIPRAKISSESTLTMESEGDASVFDMTLRVLRDANNNMMMLIKHDVV